MIQGGVRTQSVEQMDKHIFHHAMQELKEQEYIILGSVFLITN